MNQGDVTNILKNIRMSNLNNIVIGQMNVNSLSTKFDSVKHFTPGNIDIMIIPGNIDIMIIGESELDDTFPSSQFLIDGYAEPFRRDRNVQGGGIMMYVRNDIPCKQLNNHRLTEDIYVCSLS